MKVENEPKLVIDSIDLWVKDTPYAEKESKDNKAVKAESDSKKETEKLYVRVCDRGMLDVVINFLKRFPGDTSVVIKAELGGKPQALAFSGGVELSDDFVLRLKNIVGEANVKVISNAK